MKNSHSMDFMSYFRSNFSAQPTKSPKNTSARDASYFLFSLTQKSQLLRLRFCESQNLIKKYKILQNLARKKSKIAESSQKCHY
ncbi:hypothetical protein [Helicobacter sp. 23-1045]